MKKYLIAASLAVMSTLLIANEGAKSATLLSDNFDTENSGNGSLSFTGFTNWDVTLGTVDLIPVGPNFDFFPGNGLYVDLDGSSRDAGILSSKTTFNFDEGTVYNLQFALGGSTRGDSNSVTVSLGSLFSEVFTLPSNAGLNVITRTFTALASSTGKLSFANAGGDNIGLILDNVNLTSSPRPVPVPSAIFGVILAGSSLLTLKQRKGLANK